jgi:hypothetical protein
MILSNNNIEIKSINKNKKKVLLIKVKEIYVSSLYLLLTELIELSGCCL